MVERFSLGLEAPVVADLEALPVKLRRRLVARVRKLAIDPIPGESEPISGGGRYRLRYLGCRIVYAFDQESRKVRIVKINQRRRGL